MFIDNDIILILNFQPSFFFGGGGVSINNVIPVLIKISIKVLLFDIEGYNRFCSEIWGGILDWKPLEIYFLKMYRISEAIYIYIYTDLILKKCALLIRLANYLHVCTGNIWTAEVKVKAVHRVSLFIFELTS